MKYAQITVVAEKEDLELIADAMWQISDGGIEIFEGESIDVALKSFTWDYIDDKVYAHDKKPYARCIVPENNAESLVEKLLSIVNTQYSLCVMRDSIIVKTLEEKDWENDWKQAFSSVKAGKFTIVPIWEKPRKTKYTVFINPSTGFGTGQHESTAIALSLLCNAKLKDKTVLDIGTGSGILGLAAAKAGAKKCEMFDYDAKAVENAMENVELNRLSDKCFVEVADIFNYEFSCKFDIVMANLTADLLVSLKEKISDLASPSGKIIVSGILSVRWEDVSRAFRSVGLECAKQETMGEWCGAVFDRIG